MGKQDIADRCQRYRHVDRVGSDIRSEHAFCLAQSGTERIKERIVRNDLSPCHDTMFLTAVYLGTHTVESGAIVGRFHFSFIVLAI